MGILILGCSGTIQLNFDILGLLCMYCYVHIHWCLYWKKLTYISITCLKLISFTYYLCFPIVHVKIILANLAAWRIELKHDVFQTRLVNLEYTMNKLLLYRREKNEQKFINGKYFMPYSKFQSLIFTQPILRIFTSLVAFAKKLNC